MSALSSVGLNNLFSQSASLTALGVASNAKVSAATAASLLGSVGGTPSVGLSSTAASTTGSTGVTSGTLLSNPFQVAIAVQQQQQQQQTTTSTSTTQNTSSTGTTSTTTGSQTPSQATGFTYGAIFVPGSRTATSAVVANAAAKANTGTTGTTTTTTTTTTTSSFSESLSINARIGGRDVLENVTISGTSTNGVLGDLKISAGLQDGKTRENLNLNLSGKQVDLSSALTKGDASSLVQVNTSGTGSAALVSQASDGGASANAVASADGGANSAGAAVNRRDDQARSLTNSENGTATLSAGVQDGRAGGQVSGSLAAGANSQASTALKAGDVAASAGYASDSKNVATLNSTAKANDTKALSGLTAGGTSTLAATSAAAGDAKANANVTTGVSGTQISASQAAEGAQVSINDISNANGTTFTAGLQTGQTRDSLAISVLGPSSTGSSSASNNNGFNVANQTSGQGLSTLLSFSLPGSDRTIGVQFNFAV